MNTLQKTLLLKKKAELDQVDEQLTHKRDEFKSRMEDLAHKRSELKLKQQQVSWTYHQHTREKPRNATTSLPGSSYQDKETVMKFEKFVADNEAKRNRALKKYEAAQEENVSKQSEIEELTEELKRLKVRWGCGSKEHQGRSQNTSVSSICDEELKTDFFFLQAATFKRKNRKIQNLRRLPA